MSTYVAMPVISRSYFINMKILYARTLEEITSRQKGPKIKPFRALIIDNSSIWNSIKPFMR